MPIQMEHRSPFGPLGRRLILHCSYVLLSILSGIYPLCMAQYSPDPFLVSPQDTVAAMGSTVVLRCALRPDMVGSLVLWSHFEPGTTLLSLNSILDGQLKSELRDRVTITGNQGSGEFNLRITNVRESDRGRYECRAMLGLMNIVRRSATLTVVIPPDPGYPKCSMQPHSGVVPGQMVILTCQSRGGKPPPTLNWHRGPDQLGTPTTITNTQRYTLRPVDYGVVFECRESGFTVPLERSCTLVPLQAYLTVDITPRDPVIRTGESETFGCYAQGALIITYSWHINDIPLVMSPMIERFVLGGGDQLITVYYAPLSLDGTLITCVATANTGQVANASSILNVVPRQSTPTTRPRITQVVPSTTRPLSGTLSPSGTDEPAAPGGPISPGNPRPGRPDRPHRPGGHPGRPGHEKPGDWDPDDDSKEDGNGDDLINFDRDNDDREKENLAGSIPSKTVTVIGAALAGLVISVVIVATIRLLTRIRPGTKDTLITISGRTDSDEIEPNSLSTNRNTFSSFRSTVSCDLGDPKRITFSDLNREYDLPPFEPDDSLSYLGLRPESMISTRYMYEGLHSDTSTSAEQGQGVRYYEISSGEYDHSLEYEDVVSEQTSISDGGLRPFSILTDEGLYQHGVLPVPGYNSRISIGNRGYLL